MNRTSTGGVTEHVMLGQAPAARRGPIMESASRRFAIAAAISITLATGILPKQARASGSENDMDQQLVLPNAPTEPFSGQVEYSFDTALNMTRVRFSAPLDSRGMLRRIFLAPPVVHTLIASYEFAGHSITHIPDAIRLTLISDEYVDSVAAEESLMVAPDRGLQLVVGGKVTRYGVSVAERTRSTPIAAVGPRNLGGERNGRFLTQMPERQQVRISRTVTSLLSICEFLDLIKQNEAKGRVGELDVAISHGVILGLRHFAWAMKPKAPTFSATPANEVTTCL
jgi:hypothetical protein